MRRAALLAACLALLLPVKGFGQEAVDHSGHGNHNMKVDTAGAVMNENHHTLSRDCTEISRDYAFTIHAGRKYASDVPGHDLRHEPARNPRAAVQPD